MTDVSPHEVDIREDPESDTQGTLSRRTAPRAPAHPQTEEAEPEPAIWVEQGVRPSAPWWVWVITPLLVVLPALGAFLYSAGQPEVFGARTEVLYNPPSTYSRQSVEGMMNTQIARIESKEMLGPIAAAYEFDLTELGEDLEVEQVGDSTVLRLTLANEDEQLAAQVVEHIGGRYSVLVNDRGELAQERDYLRGQIAPLETRYNELQTQYASAVARERLAAQAALSTEMAEVRNQITDLRGRLTDVELNQMTNQASARIVSHATVLDDPLSPKPLRAVAAGLLAGLFLAVAFVLAMKYLGVIGAAVTPAGREATRWPRT
ncbi:MAG: hypothetical protein CSA58_01770 [Micrococcales bacterium]|nr:MAG: hypothetical protein CSA58_01770 [Micrococcales bacterium]